MRTSALLLTAVAALSVPLVAPAATASADTRLSEIICNDNSAEPQYTHHIYLTTDTPSVVEDFPEHPTEISCYEWWGSQPATYTYSYAITRDPTTPVYYPDAGSGTLSYGNGFSVPMVMPGYFYQASFTVQP